MPNVALLIGAGLIGALVAGIYLLYTDEGFNNHREQHYNNAWPPPPRNNGPRNRTNFPEGYDSPVSVNGRRRRRDEEDENCVICYDEIKWALPSTIITLQQCGHKFHKICLQQWVETATWSRKDVERLSFPNVHTPLVDASSDTCPTCRLKISVRERQLLISA